VSVGAKAARVSVHAGGGVFGWIPVWDCGAVEVAIGPVG
jgi:hypothetical protein